MFKHVHNKVRKVGRFDAGFLYTLDIYPAVHKSQFYADVLILVAC
jgi:hypothetical protein